MAESATLRDQASASIRLINQLVSENNTLRRKVEALEQQLAIISTSGKAQLGAATTKAWMKALEEADPKRWRSINVGTHAWNTQEGYATGGGLCALIKESISCPADDRYCRLWWETKFAEGHPYHGKFPRRFESSYTVSSHLRINEQVGLADTLDGLLEGIRPNSKPAKVVEACFLIYGTQAVQMLQTQPATVLKRLAEEISQASSYSVAANWRAISDLLSGQSLTVQDLQILGLKAGASADAIKTAYRQLAKQHHPDAGGDADQFHKITRAYERLQKQLHLQTAAAL